MFEWTSFEDGALPAGAILIGRAPGELIQVADYQTVAGMPPAFRSSQAALETGNRGLRLRYTGNPAKDQTTQMAGLTFGKILDRDTLGEGGRALFQADIFIPADILPHVSVLVMQPPKEGTTSLAAVSGTFYRFGTRGVSSDVRFSAIVADRTPAISQDKKMAQALPRPAWHRFAVALDGDSMVRCYVDGRECSFSPLKELALRKMMVGIVLVDYVEKPYDVYVDNLSIQVGRDAPAMPVSPYQEGWSVPQTPTSEAPSVAAAPPNLMIDARWTTPEAAWQQAQTSGKPLLIYFHSPGLRSTAVVDQWLNSESTARAFLDRHACAAVDVNQLAGGMLSQKYEIYKVPTILVISPDARSHARWTYTTNSAWSDALGKLRL